MLKIQINKLNSFKELSEEDRAIFESCGFMPDEYHTKINDTKNTSKHEKLDNSITVYEEIKKSYSGKYDND